VIPPGNDGGLDHREDKQGADGNQHDALGAETEAPAEQEAHEHDDGDAPLTGVKKWLTEESCETTGSVRAACLVDTSETVGIDPAYCVTSAVHKSRCRPAASMPRCCQGRAYAPQ
jgi:hypothetical protein